MKQMLFLLSFLCLIACEQVSTPTTSSDGSKPVVTNGDGPSGTQPVAADNGKTASDDKTRNDSAGQTPEKVGRMELSEEEWRKKLTDEEYYILRKKGTERAFTGKYDKFYKPGKYLCAGCGLELFESTTKFDSGCGWPAFYAAKAGDRVKLIKDLSHGMVRTEVVCARCDGHLGHVFENEGYPKDLVPTGQRYCINSVSIKFVPADESKGVKREDAADK